MLVNIKGSKEDICSLLISTQTIMKVVRHKNHNFSSVRQIALQYFLSIVQQVFLVVGKLQPHHHQNSAVVLNTFLIWINARKSTPHNWKYLNENHKFHFLKQVEFHRFLPIVQQALSTDQPPPSLD